MSKFKSSLAGMAWRTYPAKPKCGNPNMTVRLHTDDSFSERPPSKEAAKVIAAVLANRPAKPPGSPAKRSA